MIPSIQYYHQKWEKVGKFIFKHFLQVSNIITKFRKVPDLIIKHHHKSVAHSDRVITLNKICSCGYWVVDANSSLKNLIFSCVEFCRYIEAFRTMITSMVSRAVHNEVAFSLETFLQ